MQQPYFSLSIDYTNTIILDNVGSYGPPKQVDLEMIENLHQINQLGM